MKRLALLAAALLLAMPVFPADLGPEAVDQAWLKAANANDLEGLLACYAPDAVMYPPDVMVAKGKDAIREDYKNLLAAMTIRDATVSDTHYETHGDTAIAWGQFTITLVPKAGGDPVQMQGRVTEVCKKIGGKWLYVIDHASVPMPPPAGK
jgi:uncharacterized protein (TIGR02246 family)